MATPTDFRPPEPANDDPLPSSVADELPVYHLVSAEFELPEEEVVAGRYDLIERIARGGMGSIYRGRDRLLNRTVAVKVLRSKYLDRPDLLRRFMDEAQISAKLQHPGVVPVYEVGSLNDGRPYIAMKLIEGMTLTKLLSERTSPKENLGHFLKVFESLCQTISYAHSQGVIHRDLKPDNVMVGAFGEVLVMDWGIAKSLDEKLPKMTWGPFETSDFVSFDGTSPSESNSNATVPADCRPPSINEIVIPEKDGSGLTNHGQVFGTMRYMPPEQARGEKHRVDRRSDVFALGGILCEILTGSPPFIGSTEAMRDLARGGNLTGAYQRLDRSGADVALVMLTKHCLAVNPEDRPNDAAALAELLSEYLEGMQARNRAMEIERFAAQTQLQQAESRAAVADGQRRRTRSMAFLAAFAGVALMGGMLWFAFEKNAAVWRSKPTAITVSPQQCDDALQQLTEAIAASQRQHDEPAKWYERSFAVETACQRLNDLLPQATDAQREQATPLLKKAQDEMQAARLTWALDQQPVRIFSIRDGRYDATEAANSRRELLAHHGFDVASMAPAAVGEFVSEHPSAPRLIATLVEWLTLSPDGEERKHLAASLQEVKPIPLPQPWLQALVTRDTEAFRTKISATNVTLPALTYFAVARWLTDAHDTVAAEQWLTQGLQRYPGEFALNAELGQRLAAQPDKRASAVRHLAAATAAQPKYLPARLELAKTLAEAGQPDEAFAILREATRLDPKSAAVPYMLGQLLEAKGDHEAARAAYQQAVTADSSYAPAQVRYGQYALEANQPLEAEKAFRAALAFAPDHRQARLGLGIALLSKGEVEQALTQFDQAKLEPTTIDARSLVTLAKAYRAQRRHHDALRLFRNRAINTPAMQHEYGAILLAYEAPESLVYLKQAAEATPKNGVVLADYAEALALFGKFRTAASTYRQALESLPANAPERETYTALVRMLTRYAGLESHVTRLADGDLQNLSSAGLAELGGVCQRTQRFAHAAKFFALAAKTEPRYQEASAKAAFYAGWGCGVDPITTAQRATFRQQALQWFKMNPLPTNDRMSAVLRLTPILRTIPTSEQRDWFVLLANQK